MGRLAYDGALVAQFDDRTLMHLEVVIGNKLRRSESFNFSWHDGDEDDRHRKVIWINPSAALVYEYDSDSVPHVNRGRLEALMATANSGSGLRLVPEAEPSASAADSA